jgi:methionyl-tRNA formyltransferase
VVAAVEQIEAGRAHWTPQDRGRVTLAPKLARDFGRIDLGQPAARVLRRIRAATPRPGVDLRLARSAKLLRIVRARPGESHGGTAKPGAVRVDTGRLYVAAGDAWIELVEVQLAGKRALRADELLRGLRIPAGEEARTP